MSDEKFPCLGCVWRETIITKQRLEIAWLKNTIKRLKKIIEQAKKECQAIMNVANKVMSQHQPRGKWSFAKGAKRAAEKIIGQLSG